MRQVSTGLAVTLVLGLVSVGSFMLGKMIGQSRTEMAHTRIELETLYECAMAGNIEPLRRSGLISEQVAEALTQAEKKHGRVTEFTLYSLSYTSFGPGRRIGHLATARGGKRFNEAITAIENTRLAEFRMNEIP